MSEKDVIKETKPRMEGVIEDFRRKLATVRTGRAAVVINGYWSITEPSAVAPGSYSLRTS